MKKRIIIFSVTYHPFVGGAEQFVKEIIHYLSETWDITLITARFQKNLPRQSNEYGAKIIRVGYGTMLDKFLYPWLAVNAALKEPAFDLVHGIMETYAGLAMMIYKKRTNVPALLNLQSGTMDLPRYHVFNPLFRRIIKSADYIHAISIFLKERAIRLGASPHTVTVIPNGVDLGLFQKSYPRQRQPFRIVCVARLETVKGVEILLRALPQVMQQYPQIELLIAGDGSQRTHLEHLSHTLGIKKKVQFLGTVAHEKLPELFLSSTVAVTPSLAEGLGITIIEALATGTPVIATNVGGIPDIIQNKKNGLLVPPNEPETLAQAIITLLNHPAEQKRLGKAGKITAQKFSWSDIVNSIEKLYNNMLRTPA